MKKTVFFGPFVGEFGWEIIYWHGWVRKMCYTKYKDYHKIACSFPGHDLLYSDCDEFISHDLKNLPSRAYITDNWCYGKPAPQGKTERDNYYELVEARLQQLLVKCPKNTEIIRPWENMKGNLEPIRIKPKEQYFERIVSTKPELFNKLVPSNTKIITLFPRKRITRRPDKNWGEENYRALIKLIQGEFPEYKIVIVGTPNGAYFASGVPKGCIDLINVDEKYRMEYETAALERSTLTIGSISGAILYSLICGCPALTWGSGFAYKKLVREENPLKTRLVFYPEMRPGILTVMRYVQVILNHEPLPFEMRRLTRLYLANITPEAIRDSKLLSKLKREVLG